MWRAHELTERSNLTWIPERFCVGVPVELHELPIGESNLPQIGINICISRRVHLHSGGGKGVHSNTWLNRKEIAKPPPNPTDTGAGNLDATRQGQRFTKGQLDVGHRQSSPPPYQLCRHTVSGTECNQSMQHAPAATTLMQQPPF